MTINAPYNFAPLADVVYLPSWGELVTHDIPFKDGYCGEIELTIKAHAPILIGSEKSQTGEVHFYRQPDKKYAIPGSSLKGMLRAVLEVATFSRMRQVDDLRFGLRDISGKHTKKVYSKSVVGKQKAGFMRLGADSRVTITPCKFAKVRHEDIETQLPAKPKGYIFDTSKPSVAEKYEAWEARKSDAVSVGLRPFKFNAEDANDGSGHQRATDLGTGKIEGTLVLTGQISDRSKHNGKHHDFLFYREAEETKFAVNDSDWQNFLFVHGDKDKQKTEGAWVGYWQARFHEGGQVPVFYIPRATGEAGGVHIGLALLLKLAGDFSVHDLIDRHGAHLTTDKGLDFSDVIFGATDNAKIGALKSRISFLPAIAQGNPSPVKTNSTILNGPKASFFPNYLVQQQNEKLKLETSYATYVDRDLNHQPGIRGWKRYPVHSQNIGVQVLTPEQQKNKAVQTVLHPLPTGTTFSTQLSFHNLRAVELGAVLWALLWGQTTTPDAQAITLRHSIGMGKPFGFGQITFSINKMSLRANNAGMDHGSNAAIPDTVSLVKAFVDHMSEEIADWNQSPQLVNLLAMANPEIGDNPAKRQYKGELKHMVMGSGKVTEFAAAKMAGDVLPSYAMGTYVQPKPRVAHTARAAHAASQALPPSPAVEWLDGKIKSIIKVDGGKPDAVLKGPYLAQQWRAINVNDATLKVEVLTLIKSRWHAKGWWENMPDTQAKEARKIYDAN